MRTRIWLGLLFIAVPISARAEIERVATSGFERIEIRTGSSDLEIEPASGSEIEIEGRPEDRQLDRSANRLSIRSNGAERMKLRLPPGLNVEIATRSGDVSCRASLARLTVATTSGDLVLGPAKELEIETLSGDVRLEGEAERAKIETVSGDISLAHHVAELRVKSTSGDVVLREGLPRRVEIQTVSGEIDLEGTLAPDAIFEIRTVSGDIRIRPKGDAGYRLLARNKSDREREELVRGGGAKLDLTSFSGEIFVGP
jgi:DUF4097 and DUF4098 domain-containing protein YvlB